MWTPENAPFSGPRNNFLIARRLPPNESGYVRSCGRPASVNPVDTTRRKSIASMKRAFRHGESGRQSPRRNRHSA